MLDTNFTNLHELKGRKMEAERFSCGGGSWRKTCLLSLTLSSKDGGEGGPRGGRGTTSLKVRAGLAKVLMKWETLRDFRSENCRSRR